MGSPGRHQFRAAALIAVCFCGLPVATPAVAVEPPTVISAVKTTPAFFNPSIGQRAEISFTVSRVGTVTVEILDRDHFIIRKLTQRVVQPGSCSAAWDGRDDAGGLVPDEAYTGRITYVDGRVREVYDSPRESAAAPEDVTSCTYSRNEGLLSYTLAWPARVHVLAGLATQDPATHQSAGPVLKTVVNRQPRAAGAVVESWNGFDQSGTVFLPDLPHFVVAVTATRLPEPALITVGNRAMSFFDYALVHRPRSALAAGNPRASARHYVGLTALEDRNPRLELAVKAPFDSRTRAYRLRGGSLAARVVLESRAARYFLTPSSELNVFVDERLVLTRPAGERLARVSIAPDLLPAGRHRVVFDWAGGRGPIAVGVIVVEVGGIGSSTVGGKDSPGRGHE